MEIQIIGANQWEEQLIKRELPMIYLTFHLPKRENFAYNDVLGENSEEEELDFGNNEVRLPTTIIHNDDNNHLSQKPKPLLALTEVTGIGP